MVRGEDQLRAVGAHADPGHPQQRGDSRIEVGSLVLSQQSLEGPLAFVLGQLAQVELSPRQFHAVQHQLHQMASRIVDERGPQGGKPVQQGLPRRPHPRRVHRSG